MDMFHRKYFAFYFILLHSSSAIPQINLYHTDDIHENGNESNNTLQEYCLRVATNFQLDYSEREVMLYCMSESPFKYHIPIDIHFPKYTFLQLARQNITGEDLYLWSASIDLIERYQFYLNQPSTSNHRLLETDVFYNCTWPRFGPMCQYEFDYYYLDHSSLNGLIDDIFHRRSNHPNTFSCYIHIQCNRGPSPTCLDWSEICDGKVDCLDGGLDEESCWQVEINQCQDNEYRCINGQCIPKSFYQDSYGIPDCVDNSDMVALKIGIDGYACNTKKPSLACDDVTCMHRIGTTGICQDDRRVRFWEAMYSRKDNSIPEKCWSALKCLFNVRRSELVFCQNLCRNNVCMEHIQNTCPDMLYFPNVPVFYGEIYFAFRKNMTSTWITSEPYLCYNNSRYDPFFNTTSSVIFNNSTCFRSENIKFADPSLHLWNIAHEASLLPFYNGLKSYYPIFNYTTVICNRSNMYQCMKSSVCISIHRLMDNRYDCPYLDDENITLINNVNVTKLLRQTHYKCQTSDKYIHLSLIQNGQCDCKDAELEWCEDEYLNPSRSEEHMSFQLICDGFVEFSPIDIDGKNETDETECEQWECNNIYTHCNDEWNCPNGEDEIGCDSAPSIHCPANHRPCVSLHTNKFICLINRRVNDGKIDCLGGTDESKLCPLKWLIDGSQRNFYCMNQTLSKCIGRYELCNGYDDCEHGDDEQFCQTNLSSRDQNGICGKVFKEYTSDIEKYFCTRPDWRERIPSPNLASLVEYAVKNITYLKHSSSSILNSIFDQTDTRYHRGLDLHVWLNNTRKISLCPPSFYGNQCQYQSQRISLTIQFRALSDSWRTLFTILIFLIDHRDQRPIHSYEQITYIWFRNCQTKFHFYLLYSTRSKDLTNNYSIHIDFYEKFSSIYRGSLLLPVNFPFLPVQRQVYSVDIPRINKQNCINHQCVHGKCIKYSSNPQNIAFCQCDSGWSGRYCHLPYICTCSSDSTCLGIAANNRSICLCPLNRFGPRCLLIDTICHIENNSRCENGGQCILNDGYLAINQAFACICRIGYSGDRCEIVDSQLILSFDRDIMWSQTIFIHFFELHFKDQLIRSTSFRSFLPKQDSVMISWSKPFHLVFIGLLNKNYYLIIRQSIYNQNITINKLIQPSDRCPHIRELFNTTFLQWHLLRRMKFYHLPCQRQSWNLSCFYDDDHLCLCYSFGAKRLANCFRFDHQMQFDCSGQNECENNGQCFQENSQCPARSMCLCPSCFYGRRCQFSTNGFSLSLDAILGYHILPNVRLIDQSSIVKFSFSLTIIFIFMGLLDGGICLITFKNKPVRTVGCGLYLFGSAVTTLLTMIIFGLKFLILIYAQMTIISNRLVLQVQCVSLDFLLRVCLSMDQWLNACVAMERAMATIKGTSFDRKKSRQAARFVILILFIVIVGSCIHDPINRHLIDEKNDDDDDDDMKRTWCIVRYTYNWEFYNRLMYILHFCGPFLINLISSIVLITQKSRQQSILHQDRSYQDLLREQCQLHRNLLTAPIVLVILALPGLIITSASKCMKSSDESWLFLIGYFISLIPSMLTFVIFIVPSKFYKKELQESVVRLRTIFRRRSQIRLSR